MSKITEITTQEIDHIMSLPLVVVDFYADWCAPCKQMLPIIEKTAESNFKDAHYAKVDAGSEEMAEFAAMFGVRNIPTYLIFKNGEEVARKSGALSMAQFQEFISKAV